MSLKDERKRDLSSSEIIYFSSISPTLVAFAAETSLSFAELKQEFTQQAPLELVE